MFTSKPPKKPILKHPKSQMSLSTKKVSFENNKSYESSPGLQKSKALRNNIYKNFLQEQESFENLRNLASLRRVQSTGATIGDSERDEHLSDIDLTQARITDVDAAPEEIEELPHEDKENHSELANSKFEYPGTMDYLEVQKSGLPPQESMNLSNSSRVSVPHLEEQNQRQEGSRLWASLAHLSPSKNPSHQKYKSVSDVANEAVKQSMLSQFGKMKCEEEQNQHQEERIPSLNQTPNKPDYSIVSQEEIKEQGGPDIQVTTPHGSKKRMENSGSAEGSRLWASLTHLSPSKNQSHQKYKSVTDVANEAVKQSMLSQFGKKKYEEEHGQMSARFEEDLKASNDQVQIDRPNMDPLMATGEKLNSFSHRSFKEEEEVAPSYHHLEQGENYMSLVDQSLEHHHDQNPAEEVPEKKKSRLAYLIGQEETPWSMVLDRSLRKPELGQDSNIPKSLSMVPNDNLDLDLERLRDLRFRYEGKPGVEKVLDISKLLAMRSSLQDENQEENERLRKEEEEKQIRREAGAYKFGSALEKIIATRNEEDMQDGFECIREEYYEQLEMIRLGKISRGFDKLDEGVLSDRTFMSIGMEELKEHLNQCLINQHAQDFREKMLAYNSLMALKEYALHVKRKLAKEAQAKQHYRYNKLRKNFDSIQQHAAFCKEWLENVKGELRLLKKSKIFDAWKADARYQKINRLTDQLIEKKQMKLKKRMVDFWKDETIQMYRLPLQEGVRRHKFRLVKRAYKVLKAYAIKKNISKENNMKAYLFMMDKLTRKGFNGLVPFYMKEQTRKLNVDDYEDFIPLRICIKDKVTKISSEDKDWALLNNERCVMIDVVKKKDK